MKSFFNFTFTFLFTLFFALGTLVGNPPAALAEPMAGSPEGCEKFREAAGGKWHLCHAEQLGLMLEQLKAAEKICDLENDPRTCTSRQLDAIQILLDTVERTSSHYRWEDDDRRVICDRDNDSPVAQYLERRCELLAKFSLLRRALQDERRWKDVAGRPSKLEPKPAKVSVRVKKAEEPASTYEVPKTLLQPYRSPLGNDDTTEEVEEPRRTERRETRTETRRVETTRDDNWGEDWSDPRPSTQEPRRTERREAAQPRPLAVPQQRDFVREPALPMGPGSRRLIVASTTRFSDESTSMWIDDSNELHPQSFICVVVAGQNIPVQSPAGAQRVLVDLKGMKRGLYACASSGSTVYISDLEQGDQVFVHFVTATHAVDYLADGTPLRVYATKTIKRFIMGNVPDRRPSWGGEKIN